MNIWFIESCDGDEGQTFWDYIPAETEEQAIAEWTKVRGDYAVVSDNVYLLEDWLGILDGWKKHAENLVGRPELAKCFWQENIDESNITEYLNPGECVESGKHLTSCDDDGFCNFCGEQEFDAD